jgi:hypothetical protein
MHFAALKVEGDASQSFHRSERFSDARKLKQRGSHLGANLFIGTSLTGPSKPESSNGQSEASSVL